MFGVLFSFALYGAAFSIPVRAAGLEVQDRIDKKISAVYNEFTF